TAWWQIFSQPSTNVGHVQVDSSLAGLPPAVAPRLSVVVCGIGWVPLTRPRTISPSTTMSVTALFLNSSWPAFTALGLATRTRVSGSSRGSRLSSLLKACAPTNSRERSRACLCALRRLDARPRRFAPSPRGLSDTKKANAGRAMTRPGQAPSGSLCRNAARRSAPVPAARPPQTGVWRGRETSITRIDAGLYDGCPDALRKLGEADRDGPTAPSTRTP